MALRTFTSLTGRELAALRREAGLNQTELAQAARIGRNAVSYWETKTAVSWSAFAPRRMFEVLGITVRPVFSRPSWMKRPYEGSGKGTTAAAPFGGGAKRTSSPKPGAKPPEPAKCGAHTRKDHPCSFPPEPGKTRCRVHGGLSTGVRTEEGRARIAEAQERRWAKWRAKGQADPTS